ncbi:AMP-binding protein [Nocardia mangyaensis]
MNGFGIAMSVEREQPLQAEPHTQPRQDARARIGAQCTLPDRVSQWAKQRPNDVAVVDTGPAGRVTTWAELDSLINALASALIKLGVQPGEPVALQLPNRTEFVIIAAATMRIGAICTPLMPILGEREIGFMLRRTQARVLFVPHRFRSRDYTTAIAHMLTNPRRGTPQDLRHVIVLPAIPLDSRAPMPNTVAWHDWNELLRGRIDHAPLPHRTCDPDSIAQLLFTSGTTGEPKGSLMTGRTLARAASMEIEHLGLNSTDVIHIPSPLAHQTGFLYGMCVAVELGVPQILQARWDPHRALEALSAYRGSFVQAATPFLSDLVKAVEAGAPAPASLRIFVVTGAAVPRGLTQRASQVLGAAVCGAFGTTETCLAALSAPGDPPSHAWGTDGRALNGVQLRITDDEGTMLEPGTEGNLEIDSPTCFQGYLGRADLTRQAFTTDGWYRTEDLAVIDEAGFVHLTGRVKDVINRGGEKVPVVEIENLLHEHPSIDDVAIVAMPDQRLGERACAFAVLNPGTDLTFHDMVSYLREHQVAQHYWPEHLELIDLLPRNAAGKTQKHVLREMAKHCARTDANDEQVSTMSATSDSANPAGEYNTLFTEITEWVRGPGEEWAERIEATGTVDDGLWTELRERGYLSLAAPKRLGGKGLSFEQWVCLMEVFSRSHASVRMIVHVVNGTWRAMDPFATEHQRDLFVRPTVAGTSRVAFALTEPGNGTGADITCCATRDGDTYYLSGEKHLITFGVRCDYWLLTARLAGSSGHEGTIALMVPRDVPGVNVLDTSQTMGVTGTDHARMLFTAAPVPMANRLGAEGDGLAVALGGFLTPSRISVAMSCVGLACRAQELAHEYASHRVTFGKTLTTRQAIQFMLAENETDIEAARQLTLHAAREWDAGSTRAAQLSSMAKLNAVEMLTRVTDRALQVHGGIGYWKTSAIERVYRDARAQRFEEGTNEIQKMIVFRELQKFAQAHPP